MHVLAAITVTERRRRASGEGSVQWKISLNTDLLAGGGEYHKTRAGGIH